MWPNLVAEIRDEVAGLEAPPPRHLEQARIMGGGSSLMGMFALRGLPSDFDEWEAHGATAWGWSDLLPYFIRLENDLDRSGTLHGQDGPVAIRRHEPEQWPPFCDAVGTALKSRGFPYLSDLNAEFGDGYGPLPMSSLSSGRVSSANAYLTTEVRARPNLRILCETTLSGLVLEGRRVTGVEVTPDQRRYHAREVILSMGALHSPTTLLRSGIGPAADLARLGIRIVADRPGVGRNLQNHPRVYAAAHLLPRGRQPKSNRPVSQNVLRYSSGVPGCPPGDMQLMILNRTTWHRLGRSIGALVPAVYKPFSRGEVTLHSADPHREPAVRFRHLSDPRDLQRLVKGLQFSLELLADPKVRALCNETFFPQSAEWIRKLSRPTLSNRNLCNRLDGRSNGCFGPALPGPGRSGPPRG
jgi:5-(hydroxymethyl)furfural/furfural oxidase